MRRSMRYGCIALLEELSIVDQLRQDEYLSYPLVFKLIYLHNQQSPLKVVRLR